MSLTRLSVESFRNIATANIQPSSGINLIYGENGSGKTSLLEAIYFLGMGRSFRSHLSHRVIQHENTQLTVFANIAQLDNQFNVGFRRLRNGDTQVKINGNNIKRLSNLAEILPIQLITPESFSLLFEGPKARRHFIDWGAFHSDPSFYNFWVNIKRILKHRNHLLKKGSPYHSIQHWDKEFIRYSEKVSEIRSNYVDSLNEQLKGIIETFLPGYVVNVTFSQGWDNKSNLSTLLEQQYQRDLSIGYTLNGPHKADLRLRVGQVPIQDALSRGQLKLLICALRIAQGKLLKKQINKDSIYLVDDLPSELDVQHRNLLLKQLTETGSQVFVTSIEPNAIIDALQQPPNKMFHVKQGYITQVD